jgi:putative membrane protein
MNSAWPLTNACLNGTSALCLAAGYVFIRRKDIGRHRIAMVSAFVVSTLFLISYLAYHAKVGHVRYAGVGFIRTVYFILLCSHTVLAAVIVPLILRTITLALKGRFEDHRRWARWTLPLWFYVSVTGVVIYEMLY